MSLVVGNCNEMEDGEPEDIDRFNDETFGSGAVGKRSHLLASPRCWHTVQWERVLF